MQRRAVNKHEFRPQSPPDSFRIVFSHAQKASSPCQERFFPFTSVSFENLKLSDGSWTWCERNLFRVKKKQSFVLFTASHSMQNFCDTWKHVGKVISCELRSFSRFPFWSEIIRCLNGHSKCFWLSFKWISWSGKSDEAWKQRRHFSWFSCWPKRFRFRNRFKQIFLWNWLGLIIAIHHWFFSVTDFEWTWNLILVLVLMRMSKTRHEKLLKILRQRLRWIIYNNFPLLCSEKHRKILKEEKFCS